MERSTSWFILVGNLHQEREIMILWNETVWPLGDPWKGDFNVYFVPWTNKRSPQMQPECFPTNAPFDADPSIYILGKA